MNKLSCVFLCIMMNLVIGQRTDLSWNSLRATYGENRTADPNIFGALPVTRRQAIRNGFVKVDPTWTKCESESGNFVGYRYMKPDDPAIILLFDVRGLMAGVQSSFPVQYIGSNDSMRWFTGNQMFIRDLINGMESFTLTAYLIKPSRICTTGRTEREFRREQVGTSLYFQNGTDPVLESTEVPRSEKRSNWQLGVCYPQMGYHHWVNDTIDMDCDYFWPVFTIYNGGQLTGFGWSLEQDNFTFSPRLEHPPVNAFGLFMDPVPNCLLEIYGNGGSMTSLHFYFVNKPWELTCPSSTG